MIRVYIMVAVVTICSAIAFAGYRYVSNMQEEIITLTANNKLLENTVKTQQETIKRTEAARQQFEQSNRELTIGLQQAEAGLNELRQKLTDHDLTKLTIAKPGLIENRINDATEKLFDQLRTDTGAN